MVAISCIHTKGQTPHSFTEQLPVIILTGNQSIDLLNATRPHWWVVNIGPGNGLVLSGNKPLPEPMLTQIVVTISPPCYNGLTLVKLNLFSRNMKLNTNIRSSLETETGKAAQSFLMEDNDSFILYSISQYHGCWYHGKMQRAGASAVTVKITDLRTAAAKTHVRPVNLLYIIMFKIRNQAKFILGPVKAFHGDCISSHSIDIVIPQYKHQKMNTWTLNLLALLTWGARTKRLQFCRWHFNMFFLKGNFHTWNISNMNELNFHGSVFLSLNNVNIGYVEGVGLFLVVFYKLFYNNFTFKYVDAVFEESFPDMQDIRSNKKITSLVGPP